MVRQDAVCKVKRRIQVKRKENVCESKVEERVGGSDGIERS